MTEITGVEAWQIFDSCGMSTIKVEVTTYDGRFSASVPSGTSTGEREAKLVAPKQAVKNVNEIIAKRIVGMDPAMQNDIDTVLYELDNTADKSRLGANALLGVSTAVCKAGAGHLRKEVFDYILEMVKNEKRRMPLPYMLIAEGGLHSGISKPLSVQEFMIVPRINNFAESFESGIRVYQELGRIMHAKKMNTNVGLEGAFSPDVSCTEDVLELIQQAIEQSGFNKKDIALALDAAASSFYKDKHYSIDNKKMTGEEMVDFYRVLVDKYHIASIEDPFDENDWDSWQLLSDELKDGVRIVGDDLTTTNEKMIEQAFQKHACNALILKPNQVGTVTEAINAWKSAVRHNWAVIVSHRSRETNDNFIADFAVGLNADCKFGAPSRGERIAKYNRLLKIDSIIRGISL